MIKILVLAAAPQPNFGLSEPVRFKTPEGGVFLIAPIDARPVPTCVDYPPLYAGAESEWYCWKKLALGKKDNKDQ